MPWISANTFLAAQSAAETEAAAKHELVSDKYAKLHEQAERYEMARNVFFMEQWKREKRADENPLQVRS